MGNWFKQTIEFTINKHYTMIMIISIEECCLYTHNSLRSERCQQRNSVCSIILEIWYEKKTPNLILPLDKKKSLVEHEDIEMTSRSYKK